MIVPDDRWEGCKVYPMFGGKLAGMRHDEHLLELALTTPPEPTLSQDPASRRLIPNPWVVRRNEFSDKELRQHE
jgi:hypothetical protein